MTRGEKERWTRFTRRAALLGGVKVGLLGLLAGRLYQLQILGNDEFSTLADKNRIDLSLLPPIRGRILDRDGVPLAENQWSYRVLFAPSPDADAASVLGRIDGLLGIGEEGIERVQAEVREQGQRRPVVVADGLSWEELTKIAAHSSFLRGIEVERFSRRHYPDGGAGAHLLGYVSRTTDRDHRAEPALVRVPDYQIGRNGVERIHERDLRGSFGFKRVEMDAHRRVVRKLDQREGNAGNDLRLTVDAELQRLAQGRLEGESGAVSLLDVRTGEVLACCSSPSFDPNEFVEGMDSEEWQSLRDDPERRLINRAASGVYPPGSVFKLIVALAALEKGLVDPDERVYCPGKMRFGDRDFHCWRKEGHGRVALGRAITRSCDVYFYRLALRVGVDEIASMARRFGLGSLASGGAIPGESSGIVPTKSWKRKRFDEPWQKGETLNVGIGQGHLLATPLQLALMTARIANGGRGIGTRFVQDGTTLGRLPLAASVGRSADGPPDLGVQRSSLDVVRSAMEEVVNNPRGTAYASRIEETGLEMAGKTGTSQVRRITTAERESGVLKNEELARKFRDHAIFVGYAPLVEPRYAVSVVVEHGGSGSKAAAPVARDMLLAAQRRDEGPFAAGGGGPA